MDRVIVDMDEVIADPMGAMLEWYERQYGLEINYDLMREKGSWVSGFPVQHQALIRQRLESPGFFRHLPVMPDSREVLQAMMSRYEVFIVSAATEFPYSLKEKHDWLKDHFPFISWKQLVLCGSKAVIRGDHMIDDHLKNLEVFEGKAWIFSSPHNLSVQGYPRLNNWKEVAEAFL